MSKNRLELSDLGDLVQTERSRRGMSLREAAASLDIPFNTLARVEKGHVPDLPKFKRLVEWCGADINRFFEVQQKTTATTDVIAEHLHADRNLPDEAAEKIASIVTDLYQALARPQEFVAAHLRSAKTFRPDAVRVLGALLDDLNQALLEEANRGTTERV